jgi:hypothetical protein
VAHPLGGQPVKKMAAPQTAKKDSERMDGPNENKMSCRERERAWQ